MAVAHRGEVWTANLNPPRGREIGKVRPVLVVQADALNDSEHPMVVVLPLTTRVYPDIQHLRVAVKARERLRRDCQVVVDQPRALDRARLRDGPLTRLTRAETAAVERSLCAVLGLPLPLR